jgi:hypothetical protein
MLATLLCPPRRIHGTAFEAIHLSIEAIQGSP